MDSKLKDIPLPDYSNQLSIMIYKMKVKNAYFDLQLKTIRDISEALKKT